MIRAPATMPAAPQLFEPAGLCPDQPRGDMNTQSNPLASSDVGGTAGHDAAACVSARGECDGERVCYARDANCVLSPTTQSLSARQVVAPQAQNSGTSAAAIALVPQPFTIENAGADAPEVSTPNRSIHFSPAPPVADDEGWTECLGKTARGRAKRSAACGTSVPSAAVSAVRPSATVPAVALPAALPLPSLPAALPSVRPSLSSALQSALPTALPSVLPPALPLLTLSLPPLPSSSLPLPYPSRPGKASPTTETGRRPIRPSVPSLPPPPRPSPLPWPCPPLPAALHPVALPRLSSIPFPPQPFLRLFRRTTRPSRWERRPLRRTTRPSRWGRRPLQRMTPRASLLSTTPRSPAPTRPCKLARTGRAHLLRPSIVPLNLVLSQMQLLGLKAQPANNTIITGDTSSDPALSATKVKGSTKRQREKKKKNLTTDDGINAPPVLPPITYVVYDDPNVFTAKDNSAYHRAQELKNSKYFTLSTPLPQAPRPLPLWMGQSLPPPYHQPTFPVRLHHKPLV